MIDWKSIKDLHVNKKLEQIIGGWYGLDVFYADSQGRVQFLGGQLQKMSVRKGAGTNLLCQQHEAKRKQNQIHH